MQLRTSRRLAGAVAGALICALAAAPSADARDGIYTQVLCNNPDTGQGVVEADARFPAGMTLHTDRGEMSRLEDWAQCHGPTTIQDGVLLSTMRSFTTNVPDSGAAISYRAPSDVGFRGAELYRGVWLAPTNWATSIQRADSNWLFGSPIDDMCEWYSGCVSRGTDTPWAEANRVNVGNGNKVQGFNMTLKCNIIGPAFSCASDGNQFLRLYGGKATLEDTSNPRIDGAPSGGLVEDAVLRGTESVTVNATDAGSGVYRATVLVDGKPLASRVVDANGGRCADVNPANGDEYEFAYGRPCKLAAGTSLPLDTATLSDGPAEVAVAVEDAGGNRTVARTRTVTVDNVPPPTMTAAPTITGTTRRGSALTFHAGSWNDHGIAGDPIVARRWQRCARDGSGCSDIAGATGATYALGADDVGRRVRVVETATNSEGTGQAASELTAVVTREDGTLPPGSDGVDNDGDGQVDEPGEEAPKTDETSGSGNTRPPAGQSPSRAPSPAGSSSSSASSSALSASGANGEGASRGARLTATFAGRSGSAYTTAHGRRVQIGGRLVDEHGRPIRHAVIEAAETSRVRGAAAQPGAPVLTGSDGGFTYAVDSRSGGRSLRFAYRYQRDGGVVTDAGLVLKVRAAVRLGATLEGRTVRYRGRVVARPLPRGGKVVIVQGRAKGGRWQTFASRRTNRSGAFSGRYRLKIRRPGARLQFRARAVAEAGWPYVAGTSRAVTRTVR